MQARVAKTEPSKHATAAAPPTRRRTHSQPPWRLGHFSKSFGRHGGARVHKPAESFRATYHTPVGSPVNSPCGGSVLECPPSFPRTTHLAKHETRPVDERLDLSPGRSIHRQPPGDDSAKKLRLATALAVGLYAHVSDDGVVRAPLAAVVHLYGPLFCAQEKEKYK